VIAVPEAVDGPCPVTDPHGSADPPRNLGVHRRELFAKAAGQAGQGPGIIMRMKIFDMQVERAIIVLGGPAIGRAVEGRGQKAVDREAVREAVALAHRHVDPRTVVADARRHDAERAIARPQVGVVADPDEAAQSCSMS
jgi:hypothetical protein